MSARDQAPLVCPYHGRMHWDSVTTIKTCGKCMEELGVSATDATLLLREPYEGHVPRYKYDCGRCKFSWNCDPQCECVLRGHSDPPKQRLKEVKKAQQMWRDRRHSDA